VHRTTKTFLTLCVAALGLTVAGVAQAHRGPGAGLLRPLLAAVHADVTIVNAKGETRTVTWDRGTVSAKSATSITLARKDGKSVTLSIDSNTKSHGDVEQGRPALVVSNNGKALAIRGARAGRAPSAARKRDRDLPVHVGWALIMPDGSALSIAFDRGEVTDAGATTITLKRPDNVSVTLKIDSATKVHARGGKVNVGDRAGVFSQGGTAKQILAGPKKA
jgi:hypothetical protein